MSGLIYLNGILLDVQEATLPVNDRAYLFGEGLFETLRATGGFIPFLPEHLDRFFSSFLTLDFQPKISQEELSHAAYQTLRQNHLEDAYLRIQLSRENETFGGLQAADKYNLMIVVQPLNNGMDEFRRHGAAAVLYPDYQIHPSPLNGIKSTQYAINLRAKAYAKKQNAQEAIFADPQGHLVEGASSNLFIWNGKTWVTPPLNGLPLPGVMRRVLLSLMKNHGVVYEERPLTPNDLSHTREAILTNAIWEILPLTCWEGSSIGEGKIGTATSNLQELLKEEINSRLKNHKAPSAK